jgi:MSHA pilin protein MshD
MINSIQQRGATLVELVISIVIVSVAIAGVMLAYTRSVTASADPVILEQAVAVAEAYMEEITLKSFADPDGADGEANRADFDDVDDYHGLADSGARNQISPTTVITGLEKYNVGVTVVAEALHTAPSSAALRIDVTVTHADVASLGLTLTSYRTDY